MALIYLAKLALTSGTRYYSTGLGYRTKPSETPASTTWEPRLQQPLLYRRDAFDKGTTYGASRMGAGRMALVNSDGLLNFFRSENTDGATITLYLGEDNAAFPSGFTIVGMYRVDGPADVQRASVTLAIRDRQKDLDRPVNPARLLGSNVGSAGIEGDTSLRGQVPPLALGGPVENATPVQVNAADKIFAVNMAGALSRSTLGISTGDKVVALDRLLPLRVGNYARIAADGDHYMIGTLGTVAGTLATLVVGTTGGTGTRSSWQFLTTLPISAAGTLRDRGVPLTYGTDRANLAALKAGTGTGGVWDSCLAEGLAKTHGTTFFAVTWTFTEGTAVDARNAAQLFNRLVLRAPGFGTADISAADLGTLATLNPAPLQLYIQDDRTFRAAADEIAATVGAFWGPDRLDLLRIRRLDLPTGTAAVTLSDQQIIDFRWIPSADPGRGVPAYRAIVNERQNWTVQDPAALQLTAADSFAAFAGTRFRPAIAESAAIAAAYPQAVELTFDSLFAGSGTAGTAEAARRLSLYGTTRAMAEARLFVGTDLAAALDIASEIRLKGTGNDLGTDGLSFRLLGYQPNLRLGILDATLWAGTP